MAATATPNSDRAIEGAPELRQLVRECLALSDEPDLHALAAGLLPELPREMLSQVALKGLTAILGEEERYRRTSARKTGRSIPRYTREQLRGAAVEHDLYSLRYPTPDGAKLLGDFTRDDAEWTVGQYEQSAAADLREADKFRQIAKRAGERTVREAIPHDDLEQILHA